MSERPGPSPEDLGHPEESEKLFSRIAQTARRIVYSHPDSYFETKEAITESGDKIQGVAQRIFATDSIKSVPGLSIIVEGEAGDPNYKADIVFGDDDPYIHHIYHLMSSGEVYYGIMDEKAELTDVAANCTLEQRKVLLNKIMMAEAELQERGEI